MSSRIWSKVRQAIAVEANAREIGPTKSTRISRSLRHVDAGPSGSVTVCFVTGVAVSRGRCYLRGPLRKRLLALVLCVTGCLIAVTLWATRATHAESARAPVRSVFSANVQPPMPASGKAEPERVFAAATAKGAERNLPSRPVAIQRKVTRAGNFILWHPDAIRADGTYDVVIHFHGIPQALEPALVESGLRAFLLVIESGLVTGDYHETYGLPGSLDRLLRAMRVHVSDIAGRPMREARVAVSAWSAGSGAILPMLKRRAEADRLDAVVFSDGLHASFIEPKTRYIGTRQLEPVRAFAERAMRGLKYFALSHTAIETVDYASTTETAGQLLALLGVAPAAAVDAGGGREPVVSTRAERGAMRVLGFGGQDTRAHGRQQWAIGRTLWAGLAQRWNAK